MSEETKRPEDFDPEEENLLAKFRSKETAGEDLSVVDTGRLRDMTNAIRILRKYAEATEGKISYEINDPFPSMGYIRITGKHLRFKGAEAFMEAAKLASNVEAYAKANGSVCVDFTFHGLTKKVK